ncbi:helix-turn-helix domain-containing protein [Clostridioides sp. ZZV15-6598]|uniref:helix-turn-helix transcriptional regulator n=1 Tax=Clostridioides sp. ZZV15-6598 TaxID=2811501 RepID=UPI001D0F9D4E|nr:helix-turn-helix transcriptional regulator [Clostridioides sp. ZZV15-6598]
MNKLKTIRENQGLTQTQMAKILGISRQRYFMYEHNKRNFPIKYAFKISKMFNIELGEIFLDIN